MSQSPAPSTRPRCLSDNPKVCCEVRAFQDAAFRASEFYQKACGRHAGLRPSIWTTSSTGFAMPLARKINARMQIALGGSKSGWERI